MTNTKFRHLGSKSVAPSKELDTFERPTHVNTVVFDCFELTSYCPVTSQPDFSHVIIEYGPDKLCLESKSLKLYLWSFRDDMIFGETLSSQILNDLKEAVSPRWIKVILTQNVRGGMQLTAMSQWSEGEVP